MTWDYKTLDQLGEISRGRSKHRPRNDSSLFGGKYPFIQTADVKDANFYITEYSETYNEKGLSQSKLWHPGTLCITIAANIADTAILAIDACFPDSIMGFIPFKGISNVKFIKYAFDLLQRDCKQISQGTAQDNLSWQKLSTIKFPAPPIQVQDKIVSIISAYDDLIENNQKQIKLLGEAAQRLYKEWFVDFRFPGHETTPIINGLPLGWKKVSVAECLTMHINGGWGTETEDAKHCFSGRVIRGTDINDIKSGNYSDIPLRYHTKNDIISRSLIENDIVFELSNGNINNIGRTLLIDQYILKQCGKNTICASFCKLFRPIDKLHALILLFEIQEMQLNGKMLVYKKHGSNGINNFAFEDFLKHQFLIPDISYISPFELSMQKISICQEQITQLKESRDRLLSKLINGELEV